MGREVLSLVHDKDDVGQAASPDVSQWTYGDFALRPHLLNRTEFPLILTKLAFDEIEVVPQRLHVRVHLVFSIAWQKTKVFVAERDDGTCQNDLVIPVLLFQGACQSQQRFASTCQHHSRSPNGCPDLKWRAGRTLVQRFWA